MKAKNKAVLVSGARMLASAPAWAQNTAASVAASDMRGFASPALNTPVAYGASWGGVGIGAYGQTFNGPEDGADAVVFGLGNAAKSARLAVAAVSASFLDRHGSPTSFGQSVSICLHIHTKPPDSDF